MWKKKREKGRRREGERAGEEREMDGGRERMCGMGGREGERREGEGYIEEGSERGWVGGKVR